MSVTLARPWLRFDLGAEMRVISWAVHKGGLVRAREVVWREVRNDDLPKEIDVERWLEGELAKADAADAVAFLTSRNVECYAVRRAQAEGLEAEAVATVGLSNAERVGQREDYTGRDWGTINVAVRVSEGLSELALIEAMSIATQARTAAVMDHGFAMPSGHVATGTGTDCIAVAAPEGRTHYAGLHTAVGEALGRAVYEAVAEGARGWKAR